VGGNAMPNGWKRGAGVVEMVCRMGGKGCRSGGNYISSSKKWDLERINDYFQKLFDIKFL
jgi:hypothetical protein